MGLFITCKWAYPRKTLNYVINLKQEIPPSLHWIGACVPAANLQDSVTQIQTCLFAVEEEIINAITSSVSQLENSFEIQL